MTSARILVVEDEQITAADLEDVLGELGHRVVGVAATAAEAERLASTNRPDLALMDIRLRGPRDGIETACALRRLYDVPSVFLTAHADPATLDRAREAEPLGYIVKPFNQIEIQAVIQMALHKRDADRAVRRREDELTVTLESLGSGVLRIEGSGLVSYLNPSAERWTGWLREEAVGKHVSEVFRLIDARNGRGLDDYVREAMRGKDVAELPPDTCLIDRGGVENRVCGCVAPFRDGRRSGAVVAFGRDHARHAASETRPSRSGDEPRDEVIVAASQQMKDVLRFAQRIAESGVSTILLAGESGVGKDVVAKFVHRQSPRRDKPFVAINCAAIPETLLESELFGYEKGAFTDARAQKKGVLEMADGGTVFLDEIGELHPHLQAKLLRVLEEQSFRRLGGLRDVFVDVRILAATNKDLAAAVRAKEFREDLYYRLNVIQIGIPALRDRKDDILPLAERFVEVYNERFRRRVIGIEPAAAAELTAYAWPGNVRELRNTIERAMVMEEGERLRPTSIEIGALNMTAAAPDGRVAAATIGSSLEDVERAMLIRALESRGGNQTQAARDLGITRDTLRYRVKKYNLNAASDDAQRSGG